jgi:hypothetical protein
MPFKKTAQAVLSEPLLNPNDWEKMHGNRAFRGCQIDGDHPFCKTAASNSRYLLSHCTIMSSVAVEKDPFDFLIRPSSSHLVNNNDDAWTSATLKLSHKSFVGAFNFVEHFQNSKFSKGHILDSILRKIHLGPDAAEDWVYFCDILVATDLAHEKLIDDIRSGKVRYLSMGCVTDLVICSYCGARVTDASTYCPHLSYQKGLFLEDDDGVPRRIAELCGHKTMENGGVKFVEASWVATPAFPGAAKRSIVADEWLGPKSPYTHKASENGKFAKAASEQSDPGEALLAEDPGGGALR